jgi:hypothetical protein
VVERRNDLIRQSAGIGIITSVVALGHPPAHPVGVSVRTLDADAGGREHLERTVENPLMRSTVRAFVLSAVGLGFTLSLTGCGNQNESSMAETKGTAAPDAPKTQADFYKQQQALGEQAKKNGAAPKTK